MEYLIAGIMFISSGMGNYGVPPIPQQEESQSYRGEKERKVDQGTNPRSPNNPNR